VAVTVERHLGAPVPRKRTTDLGSQPRPGVELVFCCPWHRNLLLAPCFPKFGEPRQSSIPFGKIENDAL
jgi:hypothetical protein